MSAPWKVNRIMVPLDGSGLAESVVPMAAGMAECLGAELVLLHIIEQRAPQTRHGEPHLRTVNQAEEYLHKLSERYERTLKVEIHVHGTEENNVAQSIAAHVAELDAGMVALCTHGRSDIRRVMWGSIAQLVLRRVAVPVLIAKPQDPPRSKVSGIMVTIDIEHQADSALGVAAQIARSCGLPLTLLSVVPTAETLTGDRLAAARLIPISTAAALDAEQQSAVSYLDARARELRAEGLHVEMEVRRGEVTPTLAGAAQDHGDALLVIATHGRAGLDAVLSGSVGQGVISRTNQPVLLVKLSQA